MSEQPTLKRGQVWRNKKYQSEYEILAIAICCDNDKNNQQSIIYTKDGVVYTRCRGEFLQLFTQVENEQLAS